MRYHYAHTSTEATTGYFTCKPDPAPSLADALAYLAAHPFDDFMRRDLLRRIAVEPGASALLQQQSVRSSPLRALMAEVLLFEQLASGQDASPDTAEPLPPADASSLIYLRWAKLPDRQLQQRWVAFFSTNQREHRILAPLEKTGLPPLYDASLEAAPATPQDVSLPGAANVFTAPFPVSLASLHAQYKPAVAQEETPDIAQTIALAEARLHEAGILAGPEMRHTASLSPIALLRPWRIALSVRQGRHDYEVQGQAISYGRGLSLEKARVSCLMEVVERASAYPGIEENCVSNRKNAAPLRFASRSTLVAEGLAAVNPNDYPLEAPYNDAPLAWMEGFSYSCEGTRETVLVPVQMVGLFCNLDEITLYDAPGSTGIGAGTTAEWAMRTALLEVLERDAEATSPYSKARCFTLAPDSHTGPELGALMRAYAARGIQVMFQDVTGEMGVPVYKCFVLTRKGAVTAGYGCSLCARSALVSALTETPFPYPDGGPSGPLLRKLPSVSAADLPDYSLGNVKAEFALLDSLLRRNGRTAVYVPLTRSDLEFPVVRCLVPGMELAADRDTFSRIPRRLYANYLKLMQYG
ncbi:YcaO-like family protein [Desulfovibrio sp. OttesenSCG-928-G15]|nr:YcaO-like family protein [Desulfovibrio sp. OttesenSCG-928-G15]